MRFMSNLTPEEQKEIERQIKAAEEKKKQRELEEAARNQMLNAQNGTPGYNYGS